MLEEDSLEVFRRYERPVFFLPPLSKPYYLRMIASLVNDSVRAGHSPILQELDFYNLLGEVPAKEQDISSNSSLNTSKLITLLSSYFGSSLDVRKDNLPKSNIVLPAEFFDAKVMSDILEFGSLSKELRRAIFSTVSTTYLTADVDFPFDKCFNFVAGAYFMHEHAFKVASNLLAEPDIDGVIVFNGRSADQLALREASQKQQIEWLSLERNLDPELGFYLEPALIQDRNAFQNSVLQISGNLTNAVRSEVESWSDTWLVSQSSSTTINPFLRKHKTDSMWERFAGKKIVPIFTSSLDEDIAAEGYEITSLNILLERTISVSHFLSENGLIPIIVIHPNSLNKSWNDLSLIYKVLSNSAIEVVWPWDRISSYSLLDSSEFVITWRSTIGLEAMANGIPCYLLTNSHYDYISSAKVIDEKNFSMDLFAPEQVDRFSAKLALYCVNHRTTPFLKLNEPPEFIEKVLALIPTNSANYWNRVILRKVRIIIKIFKGGNKVSPKEFIRFFEVIHLGWALNSIMGIKLGQIKK